MNYDKRTDLDEELPHPDDCKHEEIVFDGKGRRCCAACKSRLVLRVVDKDGNPLGRPGATIRTSQGPRLSKAQKKIRKKAITATKLRVQKMRSETPGDTRPE